MRKLMLIVSMLMLIPAVASAGGGGGVISPCSGFNTGTTVTLQDSCFAGTAHFAPSDTTLTISNDGFLPHTYTAVDGSFDTGELSQGESVDLVVDSPGIYQVFCTLHGTAAGSGMAGVLVVGEAEPSPVAAQLDTGAVKRAVAEETQPLAEALDRQVLAIGNLSAAQASLRDSINEIGAEETQTAPAALAPAPAETNYGVWVPLAAGLAVGLSLALLAMRRGDMRQRGVSGEERVLSAGSQ